MTREHLTTWLSRVNGKLLVTLTPPTSEIRCLCPELTVTYTIIFQFNGFFWNNIEKVDGRDKEKKLFYGIDESKTRDARDTGFPICGTGRTPGVQDAPPFLLPLQLMKPLQHSHKWSLHTFKVLTNRLICTSSSLGVHILSIVHHYKHATLSVTYFKLIFTHEAPVRCDPLR